MRLQNARVGGCVGQIPSIVFKWDPFYNEKWHYFSSYSHISRKCPKTGRAPRKTKLLGGDEIRPKFGPRKIAIFLKENALSGKSWCPSFVHFGHLAIFIDKCAHFGVAGRPFGAIWPYSSINTPLWGWSGGRLGPFGHIPR